MAEEKVKLRLQGHEKFALREGWLNKGINILQEMPDAFLRKDASDVFGIGSNMVKSLRYWMRAFGLTNVNCSDLSELARIILEYDPYLEKTFTWWILHSNIVRNKEEATTWYLYFNYCDADDLDKEQIGKILYRELFKYAKGQKFSDKSLYNDVDVLLNMYGKIKEKSDPEDKNVSPFVKLGLLKNFNGKYVKSHPDRKSFSEMIVLYELAIIIHGKDSVSIEDVIEAENGLHKIYNLTPVMANDYLDKLDAAGYIRVDRTAGLDMIYVIKELLPEEIVIEYYKNS